MFIVFVTCRYVTDGDGKNMNNLNKISEKLATSLLKTSLIAEEEYKWYVYGIYSLIMLLSNILVAIIISIILNMKIECIYVLFFLFFIRSYAGGYHMKGVFSCMIASNVCLVLACLIVKTYSNDYNYIIFLLQIAFSIFIATKGPIDADTKVIVGERRRKVKLKLRIHCGIINVIAMIFALNNIYKIPMTIFVVITLTMILMIMQIINVAYRRKFNDQSSNM